MLGGSRLAGMRKFKRKPSNPTITITAAELEAFIVLAAKAPDVSPKSLDAFAAQAKARALVKEFPNGRYGLGESFIHVIQN